ncbi:30S ribosomal protein S20 [Fontisphaera persica]|jgi:small subunit ribosomal protein S20|uniref:30S ribosomal protein S20 n=1 Tax=Fontisphaera persica TaxID=2974023 RepID=UPI0024C08EC0|nr:30S ribosomal protein S20 [Fontisphaera persica]WCJ58143.1 30S ribosomal protein S20 [Fontisphaera persica]
MPNTKSAERRVRSSARRRLRNRKVKLGLKTLQKELNTLVAAGKKEEAAAVYRKVSSALDKAAKGGVIPKATASRKRSRLAHRVNAVK